MTVDAARTAAQPAPETASDIEFKAVHDRAMRYLKVAGVGRVLMGLVFSLMGLTGGIFIWGMTQNLAYGGAVAAIGMVAGLLSSRRGRIVLAQADPLIVRGTVREKHVQTTSKRNEFMLVMQINAAWTLHADGTRSLRDGAEGERTLTSIRQLFDGLRRDQRVCLACLPNGQAVFELDARFANAGD